MRHWRARKNGIFGQSKNVKRLMNKTNRLFYEAPQARCVEFCHENSVMQASLTGVLSDYGDVITDGWEDIV